MKKPETFDELCDSLTKPYSAAKQYFDAVILEIDIYGDTQFFYDWFSELEDKKQDTVYNNLTRIYTAKREESKHSVSNLKSKLTLSTSKLESANSEKIEMYLKTCVDSFNEISDEYINATKLSLVTHLLNTIDSYRRVQGAVDYKECNRRCSESESKQKEFKKSILLSVILCLVLSSVLSMFFIYIIGLVGIDKFVKFVNENIFVSLVGGIGTGIIALVLLYKKVYEKL